MLSGSNQTGYVFHASGVFLGKMARMIMRDKVCLDASYICAIPKERVTYLNPVSPFTCFRIDLKMFTFGLFLFPSD
jgi:hypothetical protein